MSDDDDPSPRQIAREILVYAFVVLAAGALFVAVRVWRHGPQVLTHAPHATDSPPR